MLKTGIIEFPTGRCILVEPRSTQYESTDTVPQLPVLPETLLAMELQLQSSSIDLRAFTATVLSDLGATLQILRMAGRAYRTAEDYPIRMEDCICDMGPAACFDAVACGAVVRGFQRRAVEHMWAHAREIAANAKHIAESMASAVSPDQAYLAGMLHAIGSLPAALGWTWSGASKDQSLTGLKLAERWNFPGYLRDFFCEMLMPGYSPWWTETMAEAHRLAGGQSNCCAQCDTAIRPSA